MTSREFVHSDERLGKCPRGHDWSETPIGAPETWTPGLRTAIDLLLAAHSPLAIAWGPDLATLYNEAFAAITGADPAQSVGPRLSKLCPELWRQAGPLVSEVMTRGEPVRADDALFCVYRSGCAEERYASLVCRPIFGRAARPDGVLMMAIESTDQVVGARRTAALRDVAAAANDVRSVADGCVRALDAVSRHAAEIPFALLYVVRHGPTRDASLAATAGVVPGTPACPSTIALDSSGVTASWPVATALEANSRVIVDNLLQRFDPLPAGNWPLAPRSAVVVPLVIAGRAHAEAALVLGASARCDLDERYLDFMELIASHVSAAVAAGKLHEEEERRRAARAARKQARAKRDARLRALEARLAGVLEERTRLAREIHDTLLQGITGIALQLRSALPYVETAPSDAARILDGIASLAEQTSREARQAVWNMRLVSLDWHAFRSAIESAASLTVGDAPIVLRVRTLGSGRRLTPDAQRIVLLVVREAIANAVRHAGASSIGVTLAFEACHFRVTVRDDGHGFVVASDLRAYTGHWGLLGMRERAREVGGSVAISSEPDRGTRVTLRLPLSSATEPCAAVNRRGE